MCFLQCLQNDILILMGIRNLESYFWAIFVKCLFGALRTQAGPEPAHLDTNF